MNAYIMFEIENQPESFSDVRVRLYGDVLEAKRIDIYYSDTNWSEEPEYFISGMKKFRMFRKGDLKIVKLNDGDWELYNMLDDPAELINLADSLPKKVTELADTYRDTEKGF